MKYVLTVTELNRYIKEIISKDLVLANLWVKGEISNYKSHYSGHMYFTLKDESCLLKCVMFRSHSSGLKFLPENGMKVVINGYISVFERDGQYQLYVEEMQPDGVGALYVAFEQLKIKLQQEGLFDEAHKKRIPFLPGRVGIITSSTGSVIRDIINVTGRRFSNVELKVFPVAVQGELAAGQIAHAIRKLNECGGVDVIILARGGGSLEELWAFNEEIVARSIYESDIPVISAVGHETDFTIADFAADLRAPTPSAAAELVVPERSSLESRLIALDGRLKSALYQTVNIKKIKLKNMQSRSPFRQPYNRVYQERMQLDNLCRNMNNCLVTAKEKRRAKLALLAGKLDALSPLSVIARGYGVARSEEGKIIKSVNNMKAGQRLDIELVDGILECKVDNIKAVKGSE